MAKEVARRVVMMNGVHVMEIKKDAHHTVRRLATDEEIEKFLGLAEEKGTSLTDITPSREPETAEKKEEATPTEAPAKKTTSKKKPPKKGVEPPSS